LDGDIQQLVDQETLVWFPAHLTWRAVGEVRGSNGVRMAPTDWRANRLADRLAKAVAREAQADKRTIELFKSSDAAASHAAALLGVVTRAANAHEAQVEVAGGGTKVELRRDSTPKPREVADAQRVARQAARDSSLVAAPAPAPARRVTAAPWRPPSAAQVRRAEERALTRRRVQEVGQHLRASSAPPASTRMAELAARVRPSSGWARMTGWLRLCSPFSCFNLRGVLCMCSCVGAPLPGGDIVVTLDSRGVARQKRQRFTLHDEFVHCGIAGTSHLGSVDPLLANRTRHSCRQAT